MRGRQSKQSGCSTSYINTNREDECRHQELMSGDYTCTLINQLSSSPTTINSNKDLNTNLNSNIDKRFGESQRQHVHKDQQPEAQQKKVRRRLHTSRPYQERLLNMAEARREIVTALKFHRASMKQVEEDQHIQQTQVTPKKSYNPPFLSQLHQDHHQPQSNSRIYSNLSPSISPDSCFNYTNVTPLDFFYFHNLPIYASPENVINLQSLPNQTLGLNLNFNSFEQNLNLNTINSRPPTYDSLNWNTNHSLSNHDDDNTELRTSMGDKDIGSIEKRQEIELGDTLNVESSTWWFEFFRSVNLKVEEDEENQSDELSSWFGIPNDISVEEQHINNESLSFRHDPHADLPSMDIGEIEGMDVEWLS